ncbi:glycosyl transferase, group 2 family protein [Rhodobacterales bacterium HTCC2150]|nr:glycosyl transferase, group 2 family protein [Rhodobacterales bacterium HTCC2150] [Rhodobacteraceae bacterium HTCC2150]
MMMSVTIALGAWYLIWRWTSSLNPDALAFSILVATAETLAYLGTLLFAFDIWSWGDTPRKMAPKTRANAGLSGNGPINIDIFITTYDEDPEIVRLSIKNAKMVKSPRNAKVKVFVLDDGARYCMAQVAKQEQVSYLSRLDNFGYKAGNLRNALFHSTGDFFAICDADTRLFPSFLENTLGYFRDPSVAWVQTPHWFYDIPECDSFGKILVNFPRQLTFLKLKTKNEKSTNDQDPFLVDPGYFFDVIQRRRNRNNASFCCGAGSIHRREAAFQVANIQWQKSTFKCSKLNPLNAKITKRFAIQHSQIAPFQFHVSEDLLSSIKVHTNPKWKSIYHPIVESKMLSPWGMNAWAVQKLKYAGGTFDIAINHNPIFNSKMPWRRKLHYLATFFSYFSCLWVLILLLTPILTLFTGIMPVSAYSVVFFAHLLPLLITNEIAMILGGWGHSTHKSARTTIATLPINLRAFYLALRGQKFKFQPTPKTPKFDGALRYIRFHLGILVLSFLAIVFGFCNFFLFNGTSSAASLTVNVFWACWNAWSVIPIIRAAFWKPAKGHVALSTNNLNSTEGSHHHVIAK